MADLKDIKPRIGGSTSIRTQELSAEFVLTSEDYPLENQNVQSTEIVVSRLHSIPKSEYDQDLARPNQHNEIVSPAVVRNKVISIGHDGSVTVKTTGCRNVIDFVEDHSNKVLTKSFKRAKALWNEDLERTKLIFGYSKFEALMSILEQDINKIKDLSVLIDERDILDFIQNRSTEIDKDLMKLFIKVDPLLAESVNISQRKIIDGVSEEELIKQERLDIEFAKELFQKKDF